MADGSSGLGTLEGVREQCLINCYVITKDTWLEPVGPKHTYPTENRVLIWLALRMPHTVSLYSSLMIVSKIRL